MQRYIIGGTAMAATSLFSLWKNRDHLLFHPSKDILQTPRDVNIPYEEVNISTDKYVINGWFMGSNRKKVIIFSHGNGGNISYRVHFIQFWEEYLRDTYSLFMYDYPGYGISTFKRDNKQQFPSVDSCKKSLVIVMKHFSKMFDTKDMVLYGESIGAAITAVTASELIDDFDSVILQSTFTSILDMAHHMSSWTFLATPFLPEELDVLDACKILKKRRIPLFIMHSRIDEIIPYSMFEKLKKHADAHLTIEGGHNDTVLDARVSRFIIEKR